MTLRGERLERMLADWIEIPSVTGDEGDYATDLERRLQQLGFACERQEVAPGRFNVLARAGEPQVVFCTHLDTVPPWFGPTREGRVIRGRGAWAEYGSTAIRMASLYVPSGCGHNSMAFTVPLADA